MKSDRANFILENGQVIITLQITSNSVDSLFKNNVSSLFKGCLISLLRILIPHFQPLSEQQRLLLVS